MVSTFSAWLTVLCVNFTGDGSTMHADVNTLVEEGWCGVGSGEKEKPLAGCHSSSALSPHPCPPSQNKLWVSLGGRDTLLWLKAMAC